MTLTEPASAFATSRKLKVATQAQLISVWGPAGSTGKSTLALNLAYEFSLLGQRVLLLDLDTHAPSLNQLLPVQENTAGLGGVARLIRQGRFTPSELDRLSLNIKHGKNQFRLLPGLTNPSRWPEVTPETIQQLITICGMNFDVVIADIASDLEDSLSTPESPTTRNATTRVALSLSTQTVVCLAGTQLSISRYLNVFGVLDELQKTRRLVINRTEPNQQLAGAIRALTRERIETVIPADEPAMQLAESQKLPLALARRKSPSRNAIMALAHKLLAWPHLPN